MNNAISPSPQAAARAKRKLTAEDYAKSAKAVGNGRYHVASSSKPSQVREVRVLADGSMKCSCPANPNRPCVHRSAVEAFIEEQAPIQLKVAEPCCYGCKVNSSLGCYRKLNTADAQWAQAI